ncbi:hypothetical protein ACFQJ5_16765 [Halomicroarcula sp. GCM10025324]|uniref:hypothetical protein n=1 Tax=Haloarcula TaxID=2237 RepID=UPI0023E8BE92|nr:hypothetical protein [Halomicroarcula sp. ZS-22-S1]
MVARGDVCESCGTVCRATMTRFADGSRWGMCHECTRQWLLIWRFFCERQPRQANRVRAQANSDSLARADGGER